MNGTVKTFSTEKGIFTETRQCGESTQGRFTGIAVTDRYSLVDEDIVITKPYTPAALWSCVEDTGVYSFVAGCSKTFGVFQRSVTEIICHKHNVLQLKLAFLLDKWSLPVLFASVCFLQ